MASSIAGPSQPRPRPRPPRLEGQADDAAAAAAVAQMPRRGGTSNATPISLETFQSTTFDVSQFVTQLMDDNVKRGTKDATGSSGGFDPSPHIRTLESALAQLLPLRKANAQKTSELERSVAVAERAYRSDVRGAKAGFETVNTQFQALDSKIMSVGRTAVRIGEQLESIDRLRQRGSEAHDLILYYNDFAAGDTSRLEQMRKEGGREGRQKVAVAARRLLSLSKEVEGVEGADKTRETIERYCERFEKEMLRLFDRYYRKGDPKAMAHCAKTLEDFNGGQSCIQIYVNQHDFFISKERVQETAGGLVGGAIWDSLPDPNSPAPKSEPGLTSLYDEIRITVGQEAQIVTAVFPHPATVMQVFLQRVFAQVVQGYIETLIQTASSSSTLAYLRILRLARAQTSALINDLRSHEFFRPSASSSSSSLIAPLGSSSAVESGLDSGQATGAGAGSAGIVAVTQMLDHSMDELFVPYMEGSRYMDKEGKNLTELYAATLIRFTNWHRAVNKAKSSNTIFDRMVNQLSNAAHQAAHSSSGETTAAGPGGSPQISSNHEQTHDASRLDRLMKFSGLSAIVDKTGSSSHNSAADPSQMFEEGDGELHVSTAEKMLEWHAEAVGRMVELSPASDVPRNAYTLLKVLADSFGKGYLETALDTALHQLTLLDGKTEPDLSPLLVIRQADMIMHLWQKYISTALVPLAGTSVTVRREMGIFNNHVRVRIEGKVNSIVQRALDAIVNYLSHALGKQKKGDFKPKNDELAFARINTEPCLLACDFLGKVREVTAGALTGRNAEVFLTEVGVTFHSLLLEHLKKFPVSAIGGLVLTKDLALYQDTIATFALAPISDRFEMLRQLGNVFIVQPDILRSYLQEGYLARIENRLLRPFVMCRSDYGDYPRKFWDDVFGPDETAGTGATAGAGVGAGAVGAAAAQLGTQAGGAIASTLSKLPRLGNFGSGTSAFSAQMQSLRASVATKKDGGGSSPTTDGRFSPVPASPRIPSAPGPPPPPPPRGGGGPPPSLPPRSAPSPVLHQRPPSRSGTPDPSGSNSSISRKPSLFNSLMRDFEGLGLRDDGTGEFGTPAGGAAGAGAGAGRGSVADGSSVSKRGSLQSIRSVRSVRE
ncbi:Exocyst complex component 5 [Rhodotorula mucilaginosa]|uniref:Exocyst complex component 5 n=1 Tax=Rhodotorula mucilaginosa TaxID=5537 RepID=A0A9P6VWT4_RHOMI|nr:Exocyst complex component 5 [Rhodotorula mucilaginosa]